MPSDLKWTKKKWCRKWSHARHAFNIYFPFMFPIFWKLAFDLRFEKFSKSPLGTFQNHVNVKSHLEAIFFLQKFHFRKASAPTFAQSQDQPFTQPNRKSSPTAEVEVQQPAKTFEPQQQTFSIIISHEDEVQTTESLDGRRDSDARIPPSRS